MGSCASAVFSAALEGCRQLQAELPSDEKLEVIVAQLELWQSALSQKAQVVPLRQPWRFDPRYIQPLSEELARLVRDAAHQAKQLGFC